MAHILIVAATSFEIQPLLDKYAIVITGEGVVETHMKSNDRLSVLITGVGMVNTAFAMGRHTHHLYDAIINIGVCGAFNHQLKIGEVVQVSEDELSEMGAEDGDTFIKYHDMGLGGTNKYYSNWLMLSKEIAALKKVKAITVNKVHGANDSIESTKKLFAPDIESMEGAAFYAACERADNFIQIRAVSNYVEKRDKSKWNMPLAIEHLNKKIIAILQEIFDAH